MTTKPPTTTDQPTGATRPSDPSQGQPIHQTPTDDTRDPDQHQDPHQAYRRFARHAAITVAALAVVGFWPTRNLAGDSGLVAMVTALLADLAASTAGTLPIWWSRIQHPSRSIGHQLGAMALRLLVVLVLGVAVALSGFVHVPAFLIWLAIGHSGLLIADTVFARTITAYAMQHPIPTAKAPISSARSESR